MKKVLVNLSDVDNSSLEGLAKKRGAAKSELVRTALKTLLIDAGMPVSQEMILRGRGNLDGPGYAGKTANRYALDILLKSPNYFWQFVDKSGGEFSCWPWTGRLPFHVDGVTILPYRTAWELTHREWVPGEKFESPCKCCNPKHTYAVQGGE